MNKTLQRITGRERMPSIKRFLARKQREKSIMSAHENHFKTYEKDYSALNEYVQNFRNSGGLKHQYQVYKLWCLQNLLDTHKPKSILELGSGSSTLVFSNYSKKNSANLLSVDENAKWAKNTSDLVKNEIANDLNIIVHEKMCLPARTPPEIKYNAILEGKFDFVFIDGPSLQIGKTKLSDAVNSNVFDLEEKPDVIVIDVRKATALELSKRYSEFYDVYLSDLFTEKPVSDDYAYFSVFIKKQ